MCVCVCVCNGAMCQLTSILRKNRNQTFTSSIIFTKIKRKYFKRLQIKFIQSNRSCKSFRWSSRLSW